MCMTLNNVDATDVEVASMVKLRPRSLTKVRLERLRRVTCKEVAYCRIDVEYCDDVERCVTTS